VDILRIDIIPPALPAAAHARARGILAFPPIFATGAQIG
jgi:hypothetical protein